MASHGQAMARPWTRAPCRGEHLSKKRTPEKKSTLCFFCDFMNIKKMRDVRTIIFAAEPRRDL